MASDEAALGARGCWWCGVFPPAIFGEIPQGLLARQGWKLRKIHELDALLDFAVEYNPGLKTFLDLWERVLGYCSAERYPPLEGDMPTAEDIAREAREAKKLIEALIGKPVEGRLGRG